MSLGIIKLIFSIAVICFGSIAIVALCSMPSPHTKNQIIFSEENLQGFRLNTLPPEKYRREHDLIVHPNRKYPQENL